MEDYLQNKGQWPLDIITENKPNLEQILTGQADQTQAAAAKGAKAAPAKAAAADTFQLEEGDSYLPLERDNNFELGEAVERIINMNFDARENHKRPRVPSYLNLKMCFIGYAFAGKKTQANRLAEAFPDLDLYQLNDLVTQAVAYYESHPEPIQSIDNLNQPSAEENIN